MKNDPFGTGQCDVYVNVLNGEGAVDNEKTPSGRQTT